MLICVKKFCVLGRNCSSERVTEPTYGPKPVFSVLSEAKDPVDKNTVWNL